jgi:chromosome partitioning protein
MASGVDKHAARPNGCAVLLEEATVADAVVATDAHYDLLPGNGDLTAAELKLMDALAREHRLKEQLAKVTGDYDTILIDCPPSLNLLTLNALTAADGVLIPVQCEYYALEGLSDLVNTIKKVHANLNTDLRIIGLLRVMFDPRMTLSQQVSSQLEQHFGDKVFKTIIPRNVRLAEAPSYGMPGVVFDPSSKGAQAYIAFGAEMVERIKTM